jgi:hypothetical protein
MPVLTIKTNKLGAQRASASFARQIKKKIVSVLARGSDRVLIVYEKEGANIYYEPAPSAQHLGRSRSS